VAFAGALALAALTAVAAVMPVPPGASGAEGGTQAHGTAPKLSQVGHVVFWD
jgi:hypothetical protein